jgi:hypothetical protein
MDFFNLAKKEAKDLFDEHTAVEPNRTHVFQMGASWAYGVLAGEIEGLRAERDQLKAECDRLKQMAKGE